MSPATEDTIADVTLKRSDDGVSIPEAAQRLNVEAQTVRNWVNSGKLPGTRWGPDDARIIRIDPADLEHIARELEGLTIAEAADRIGVEEKTMRTWVRTGKVPARRPARGIVRIDAHSLDGLGPRPVVEDSSRPSTA